MSHVPPIILAAWEPLRDARRPKAVREISANVSTNRVYNVTLSDDSEVIAKVSSYGSYVHFRQDHELIHQWIGLLKGTRFASLLAPVLVRDGKVHTFRQESEFVVFYVKKPFYDFLQKRLPDEHVDALAREMAALHRASERASEQMDSSWKSVGSDIATLYDLLGNRPWRKERAFGDVESELRRHCECFLENAEELGYHQFPRIPVLVDWNIGNFSVGFDREGFKLYSRWDYDWFRVEPRTLDFYFCARVVRGEGDQSVFSYLADPLLEPRFRRFLRVYHREFPLGEQEILFIKEAYRFFVLNYVVRSGEHFFRQEICTRLQKEAVEQYLPALERLDLSPLLEELR